MCRQSSRYSPFCQALPQYFSWEANHSAQFAWVVLEQLIIIITLWTFIVWCYCTLSFAQESCCFVAVVTLCVLLVRFCQWLKRHPDGFPYQPSIILFVSSGFKLTFFCNTSTYTHTPFCCEYKRINTIDVFSNASDDKHQSQQVTLE